MNFFSDLQDQVLSQKCKDHPNYPCDKIYLNQNAKERRICDKCLKENKYLLEEILCIRDLIETDENTILDSYPPLRDHSLLPKLISQKEELVSTEIDAFFDEMLKELQIAIAKKKQEIKERLIKRNNMQQNIIDTYKEVANLDALKKALFTKQAGSVSQLEQVIQQALQNTENNTRKIEKLIKDLSDNSGELQLEEPRKKMKEITDIIIQLNLFDDSSKDVDLLPNTSLIKTTKGDSQQASITKNPSNNLMFVIEADSILSQQASLDFILEASVNYLIQIELQQKPNQSKFFDFGIKLDSNKNSSWVYYQKLCYYDNVNNCEMGKLVKGPPIINKNPYERRSLECRINLAKKFFRVGTLPDYAPVIDEENSHLIDPAGSYRFTLAGLESMSKVIILKLQKVKSFDTLI